jgi:adenosylhomocysteine nucleosidase
LLRRLDFQQNRQPEAEPPTWIARHADIKMALILSGVGQARATSATKWALKQLQPRGLIFAGVAGGLNPRLHVADVITPARVIDGRTRETLTPTMPGPTDDTLVTVDRVINTPGQKAALYAEFNADAVDMETAAAASLCDRASVPWRSARAICDTAHAELPNGLARMIDDDGRIQWRATAGALLGDPQRIGPLIILARAMRRATRALADAIVDSIESQ